MLLISVTGTDNVNIRNTNLTFKNNSPLRSCISKINNTFIDNSEDLDIVLPTSNLSEYSDNYSVTSGSLWNYYRDDVNDAASKINNKKTTASKSFEYKTKLIGNTPNNNSSCGFIKIFG